MDLPRNFWSKHPHNFQFFPAQLLHNYSKFLFSQFSVNLGIFTDPMSENYDVIRMCLAGEKSEPDSQILI